MPARPGGSFEGSTGDGSIFRVHFLVGRWAEGLSSLLAFGMGVTLSSLPLGPRYGGVHDLEACFIKASRDQSPLGPRNHIPALSNPRSDIISPLLDSVA